MSGRHRKIVLKIPPPLLVPEALRDPIRSPHKIQQAVFERDGYRCRYCGNKLIAQEFIKAFIKQLNSPFFQRGKTNLTTHGIIHISWPVADHVIPWNLGGRTDLNNLVSACAACNYGKDGNTIEQLGIENPFNRPPVMNGWNGLLDKMRALESVDRNA
jgi:5-methylcytosine-specific restriction endonuclease McrA